MADLEAISALKNRYWTSVDNHRWTEATECFAPNAEADYPGSRLAGRQEIAAYLETVLGRGPLAHLCTRSDVDLTGPDTAQAIWEAEVHMVDKVANLETVLQVRYEDVYVKLPDNWYMLSSRMRILESDAATPPRAVKGDCGA